jgi:hypothetical protein
MQSPAPFRNQEYRLYQQFQIFHIATTLIACFWRREDISSKQALTPHEQSM